MTNYRQYLKDNILLTIYQSVSIELPNLTFPETQDILENKTDGVSYEKVLIVNGLKRAWEYAVENNDQPINSSVIKNYNFLLMDDVLLGAGKIRPMGVRITGTSYVPPIPTEESVEELLEAIMSEPDEYRQGMKWFAMLAKSQIFRDGNKRTAEMVANHYLMQNNIGLFLLPDAVTRESTKFTDNLIDYYESDDVDVFVDWLLDNALQEL